MDLGAAAVAAGGNEAAVLPTMHEVPEDIPVTDTTPVAVFTIPVEANKTYEIDILLALTAVATNVGFTPSMTVPSGATFTFGGFASRATAGEVTGQELVAGSNEAGAVTMPNSKGSTEAPVLMKARVTTGGTAGDAVLLVASESTSDVTVEAGSWAAVREVTPGEDMIVVAEDVVNSSNVTFANALSFTLEANKTYFIDGVIEYETAASTTGYRPSLSGIPVDATALELRMLNNGTTTQQLTAAIRDTTESASTAARATPQRNLHRFMMLVRTTDTSGTLLMRFRSEINTSAVTVHAGSFATFRDVSSTVTRITDDQPTTDNTNYTTGFSYPVSANKRYLFRSFSAYTTSGTGVGMNQRIDGIPSGATVLASLLNPDNISQFHNAVRDNTALDNPGSSGATEMWSTAQGVISVSATPGTLTWRFKLNDADTGTVTHEAGSWALLEEVQLAA